MSYDITDPLYSAYKNCHNTETILLDLTKYIGNRVLCLIRTKHYDYLIFVKLELSDAFDTINYTILFIKLQSLGIN